jgi:uncharacterized protein YbjT (DUF2867 family)
LRFTARAVREGKVARGKKRSPEEVERGLAALAEHGSSEGAARATGIPASTLRTWKLQQPDEFDELRREKRSGLVGQVWEAAGEALKQVLSKVGEASPKDAAVIFGIVVDKGLLLGGEPTEIMKQLPQIVYRGIDDSEYEEREQE